MRTKTPEQLHNQWKHISGYVRQRGKFMEYFLQYARYGNRMKEYLGSSPYWCMNTGYQYTKQNNAPVPVSIYTKND
jgi:hypothetical protein